MPEFTEPLTDAIVVETFGDITDNPHYHIGYLCEAMRQVLRTAEFRLKPDGTSRAMTADQATIFRRHIAWMCRDALEKVGEVETLQQPKAEKST